VLSTGAVQCWGSNEYRRLGDGTNALYSTVPVDVVGISDAVSVHASRYNTCVRRSNGSVKCWGSNVYGQIGDGTDNFAFTATDVAGLSDAVQIGVGEQFACALRTNGQVMCWGRNDHDEMGDGTGLNHRLPNAVPGIDDAVELSVGALHACVRHASGLISCWGTNTVGTLGRGTFTPSEWGTQYVHGVCGSSCLLGDSSCSEDPCATVLPVEEVIAAAYHTCARQMGGRVFCWGRGQAGSLGDGTTRESQTIPRRALDLGDIRHLASGWGHSCGIRSNGETVCWGTNDEGQLGDASTEFLESRAVPVAVTGSVELVGGLSHTCALDSIGMVRCWGDNAYAQLGNRSAADSSTPVVVQTLAGDLTGIVHIAASGRFTCAIDTDSNVGCWGINTEGQLGIGSTFPSSHTYYSPVPGLTGASQLAVGNRHACALIGSTVQCWGFNSDGQLGDGSQTLRTSPVPVAGLSDVVEIRAGTNHTCARRMDGSIACWGENTSGQLGVTGAGSRSTIPVDVPELSGTIGITCGGDHTCALHPDGSLSCWGHNFYGQVGNSETVSVRAPVNVIGLP
jgi:alpha-tubulin suppressor-like RCC1 family protein